MSTVVFVDTATSPSPTSLLRLPFAPDRTSASTSSRPSSSTGTAGIVFISVGVGALVLSILVALGVMVMVRRRAKKRREELIRTERVCWREGEWRSISDLEIRRAKGKSLMRRGDELEVEEDGEGEKRLSTSLIGQTPTHPSFAQQQQPPSSTPLPPYFPTFPRSRPLQDIPSDAASFNTTTQAHTPYTSLVRTSSSRPATHFSGDASSGYSVPFVLPPPPVRTKSGRGRWE